MRSQASEYYDKDTVDYFNYWHDFASKHLYGIEINDEIARVAKMNMIVHDDGHTNVISFDALDSIDKIIFVRKRKADEKPDENEAIFMAAPALIGYDATGRKTDSQLDEIIQKYEEFQKDATPFFA